MPEGKYIVVKSTDVQWTREEHESRKAVLSAEDIIEDAVVIRLQDVFAAPALHSYSNAMAVALELLKKQDWENGEQVQEEIARLQKIADFFHDMAILAEQHEPRRLPT